MLLRVDVFDVQASLYCGTAVAVHLPVSLKAAKHEQWSNRRIECRSSKQLWRVFASLFSHGQVVRISPLSRAGRRMLKDTDSGAPQPGPPKNFRELSDQQQRRKCLGQDVLSLHFCWKTFSTPCLFRHRNTLRGRRAGQDQRDVPATLGSQQG